eukprot:TRINITY_DN17077_c0_g1_i1.p2 TRINITY_DN17077_c0_g1~~TRINITY_DN17077_c0_g1_i1.p2  ORF type:complete len:402 (+),score=113.59 TRINITY_DN17077_c0_g1_i1:77-1282(+)
MMSAVLFVCCAVVARTKQEVDAEYFRFLRKDPPPQLALASINGMSRETPEVREYANDVCADLGYSLRDPSELTPRIFWAVMYDKEETVLEVSLFEMQSLVEAVVVVEANVTQAGFPRRILGPEHFDRFKVDMFYPRMVHQPFYESGCVGRRCYSLKFGSHELGRERFIRNTAMVEGWARAGAKPHDIVVIADVDEVPSARYLYGLRRCAWNTRPGKSYRGERRDPGCRHRPVESGRIVFFNSYLNCPSYKWYWHPNAITYRCVVEGDETHPRELHSKAAAKWTPDDIRSQATRHKNQSGSVTRYNIGWHLRNFLTVEEEQHKYMVYGHPRHESKEMITRRRRLDCVSDEHGPRGAAAERKPPPRVTLRELPQMVQLRPHRFASYFHPTLAEGLAQLLGRGP